MGEREREGEREGGGTTYSSRLEERVLDLPVQRAQRYTECLHRREGVDKVQGVRVLVYLSEEKQLARALI